MKQVTPFVISEFTNPSGKIVFQLYARIDGQRFRKNFQTRTEAEAERQVLSLPGKSAHGHHRPAQQRDFSQGQGTVHRHAAQLDEASPDSASPRGSLRLLRRLRSRDAHSHPAQDAGSRVIHSHACGQP